MASLEGTIVNTRSFAYLLACFAIMAAIVSAQSLAEIAEREKKRREELPASKVIRDEDLATSGTGASVSEMGSESQPSDFPTPEELEPNENEEESDWPEVFAQCRSRYNEAKAMRDQKQDLIVTGLPIGTDLERIPCSRIMRNEFTPGWVRYAIDCERIAEEVVQHEEEMRQIQDECYNEARIRGIPYGEARLE